MRRWSVPVAAVLVLAGCSHPDSRAEVSPATTMASAHPATPMVTAANAAPDPRVGAVFLAGASTHTCTGSVVHSRTGDLVLTAAHCLADGIGAVFVPGFHDSAAPDDMWTIDTVYLDPRWIATQDPLADYAFARVSRASGGSIEVQAGAALTLGTAPAAGTTVAVTGYPVGDGGGPVSCRTNIELVEGFPSVRCSGLVDGTSGAPWTDGASVTAVTGGREGGGCDGDTSYSSPFDQNVGSLLARAEAGGPGDAAPNAFASDC